MSNQMNQTSQTTATSVVNSSNADNNFYSIKMEIADDIISFGHDFICVHNIARIFTTIYQKKLNWPVMMVLILIGGMILGVGMLWNKNETLLFIGGGGLAGALFIYMDYANSKRFHLAIQLNSGDSLHFYSMDQSFILIAYERLKSFMLNREQPGTVNNFIIDFKGNQVIYNSGDMSGSVIKHDYVQGDKTIKRAGRDIVEGDKHVKRAGGDIVEGTNIKGDGNIVGDRQRVNIAGGNLDTKSESNTIEYLLAKNHSALITDFRKARDQFQEKFPTNADDIRIINNIIIAIENNNPAGIREALRYVSPTIKTVAKVLGVPLFAKLILGDIL